MDLLQAVLKKIDSIAALNENTQICDFRKRLRPLIQAQLDNWGYDLDRWNKVVKKVVNVEAKASW